MSDDQGVRLQKVLAAAGIASRRAAEQLIDERRVEVNDGSRIPPPRRHLYLVLNKPLGVVSTMEDPEGRPTLTDLVPHRERLFHVGRLDTDTEGLIVLTNHGEFAHRLAHPSYEVSKTYLAEVEGVMENHALKRLEKGVTLDDGPVRPDKIRLVQRGADRTLLEVTLHEGRNRVVRRMMDAVGHPVRRLSRTAIGPIRLGRLKVGQSRELTREELGALLDLIEL